MATKKYTVTIDPEKMRIGDLEVVDNLSISKGGAIAPFFEMLDRIATFEGIQDFRSLPLKALGEISEAIRDAVGEASDAGN